MSDTLSVQVFQNLVPTDQVIAWLNSQTDIKRVANFSKAVQAAKFATEKTSERREYYAELAIWSDRRLGLLMLKAQEEGTLAKNHRPAKGSHDGRLVLDDIGINYNQSSRCKSLASVDEDAIREAIAKQDGKEITKAAVLAAVKKKPRSDKARKTASLSRPADIPIRKGDFRQVLSDLSEVDAVITDPPYGKGAIPLWKALGKFCSEKLKDGGVLIAYSGQMYLPQVLGVLAESLDYFWTMAVVHEGSGNLTPLGQPCRKVVNKWKPLLFFCKRGHGYKETFPDLVKAEKPDKSAHNWAQSSGEAEWLVSQFTNPGELVVDPFAGGGTIGIAALKLKRQFVGAEIIR